MKEAEIDRLVSAVKQQGWPHLHVRDGEFVVMKRGRPFLCWDKKCKPIAAMRGARRRT